MAVTTPEGKVATGKPFVPPKRPAGDDWVPIRQWIVFTNPKTGKKVRQYVVVGWTEGKGSPVKTPTGPGGPGRGGYGGGGGGGDAGLSQYIQRYRIMFGKNVNPPSDLLAKAKANNWSIAYWDMQVRLNDKKYIRSAEAKQRILPFKQTMKSLFPNIADSNHPMQTSKMYKNLALQYLRQGWNSDQLLEAVSNTRAWRRANPQYKQYLKGQAALGTVTEANPLMYKQYVNSLKGAFAEYGMEMPTEYLRSFFRSRYASKAGFGDFSSNLKNLAQGASAFGTWEGTPLNPQQTKDVLFGGKEQSDLRQRISRAFQVEQSMAGSQVRAPEISLDQKRLTQPLL